MPRRRQRFSDLERQFKESGGTAAPGSRLAGYIDFKKGINKIDVSVVLTAAQRKRVGYGILPFNLTPGASPTDADRYAAAITQYSNTGRTNVGLTSNKCGYNNIVPATQQERDFYPALLKVFVATSNTTTSPISGITKKEYTRTPGRTYAIPFGRTITDVVDAKTGVAETTLDAVDQEDVRKSLASQAADVTNTETARSVSYEPELFRPGRKPLKSPGL